MMYKLEVWECYGDVVEYKLHISFGKYNDYNHWCEESYKLITIDEHEFNYLVGNGIKKEVIPF